MMETEIPQEGSPADDLFRASNMTHSVQVRTVAVRDDAVKEEENDSKRGLESLFDDQDQQSG
jgi:hypothetical protein